MNLVSPTWARAPMVDTTHAPEGLSAIHSDGCHGVIWHRKPLATFQSWIDGLSVDQLPKARLILRPDHVQAALSTLAHNCGTPDGPEREMLVDDISAMAVIFADVMQTEYIRLRLDVITGNACRKFHVDAVTARLICTYRGTGTQYGTSHNGGAPKRVFTVPTGAPMVLRGTCWPDGARSELLHRSPPIEGRGETRLLLVLDPVIGPSDGHDHACPHLH